MNGPLDEGRVPEQPLSPSRTRVEKERRHRRPGFSVPGRTALPLWLSQIFGMGLASLALVLTARLLGATTFGRFAFLQSVFGFLTLFVEWGTAVAAGRLIALTHDRREQRELVGAWLVAFIPFAAAYVILASLFSFVVDTLFNMDVRTAVLLVAPLSIGMAIQTGLRELLQGLGAVRLLSALNILPWLLFLLAVALFSATDQNALKPVIMVYFLSFLLSSAIVFTLTRPVFTSLRERVPEVRQETRAFGRKAFVGRVIGVGTFQLDAPLIAYFSASPTSVGFYVLAKSAAAPLPAISRAISIGMFRRLVAEADISRSVRRANAWSLGIAATSAMFLSPLLIREVLPSYSEAIPLVRLWIVAAVFQGLYQLPNLFLAAKGEGKVLRSMAFQYAIVNVTLNLLLIPPFDALGATLASGGAYLFWLIVSRRQYALWIRQRAHAGPKEHDAEAC